jgi:hypothetical protein
MVAAEPPGLRPGSLARHDCCGRSSDCLHDFAENNRDYDHHFNSITNSGAAAFIETGACLDGLERTPEIE